jgi:hypothetical protein
VCVILGGLALLAGYSAGGPLVWIAVLFGSLLAAFGVIGLRGIGAQTVTFDRAASLVLVRTQHFFGRSATQHRLTDIADVVIEREAMANGREYYRTAFVMHDRTHRGWTAYAHGEVGDDLIAAVRAIRDFLGTANSATAPDGTPAFPLPLQTPPSATAVPLRRAS